MTSEKAPERTYDWNHNMNMPIGMAHLEDAEMAGRVRMLMRDQLNHEAVCTAARDRIMCLMGERDAARVLLAAKEAEIERLREALEPSGATKYAYSAEFEWTREIMDENGDEATETLVVPWTVVKDIMYAISARAALAEDRCRKCGGEMKPSKATDQTFTGGTPDFPGDTHAATLSAGGPGKMIDCMKCESCGWSVTALAEGE